MRTIKILLHLFIVFLFVFSCKCKEKVGNITNDKISKTPEAIANGMRVNYRKPQGMLDILNAFIVVNGIKYPINTFTTSIVADISGETDRDDYTLRTYFIQITQDYRDKSQIFSSADVNKLYIAFMYVNDKTGVRKNPFLFDRKGTKYQIAFADLEELHLAYQCNIKSKIIHLTNDIKNTDYVKVNVKELFDYINIINQNTMKPMTMEFELSESIIHNKNISKEDKSISTQAGYLVFFNNVLDSSDQPIADLSNYNMNSLCPNQCP